MPILRITSTVFAALAAMLAASMPVAAQSWPQRTVKFIIPLGPGAGADIGARLVAERLQPRWGQSIVVENRPGGDAIVAISAFISAADDHTFLFAPSGAFTAHPYQHAKMPYDRAEIVPVARLSNTIVALAVPTALGVANLADLVKLAVEQPGKLNFAAGTGATDLQFQAFSKLANVQLVRVPYRDPVQPANDLSENRIQFYSAAYAIVRPQVQAGKVRLIAITAKQRAAVLPDVQTVREAGYPALEFEGLNALFGSKNLAPAVRERIASEIREIAGDKLIADRLTATGQIVNPGSPAELAAAVDEQRATVVEAAKVLGLKAGTQ